MVTYTARDVLWAAFGGVWIGNGLQRLAAGESASAAIVVFGIVMVTLAMLDLKRFTRRPR